MEMNILSGGQLRMKKHVFIPAARPDEDIDLPISCFLIRHSQGNFLFDTGCHPTAVTNARDHWGDMAEYVVPTMGKKENVVDALGDIGLGTDDIDLVVNSHLHMDHCGCNEFFKKATMIVHEAEFARVRDPKVEGQGYFKAEWDTGNEFDLINTQRDLFGDDRIILLPLPGHTPGSIGALLNFENSGTFLLASDAVAIEENLNLDIVSKNLWDRELSVKSVAEVRKIQSQGTKIIFGHDINQWQNLKKGAETYD